MGYLHFYNTNINVFFTTTFTLDVIIEPHKKLTKNNSPSDSTKCRKIVKIVLFIEENRFKIWIEKHRAAFMKKLKNIAYNIIQIIKIVNILFLARKE